MIKQKRDKFFCRFSCKNAVFVVFIIPHR
jgi:hypothetical protein